MKTQEQGDYNMKANESAPQERAALPIEVRAEIKATLSPFPLPDVTRISEVDGLKAHRSKLADDVAKLARAGWLLWNDNERLRRIESKLQMLIGQIARCEEWVREAADALDEREEALQRVRDLCRNPDPKGGFKGFRHVDDIRAAIEGEATPG
jgi:hypothetical protein